MIAAPASDGVVTFTPGAEFTALPAGKYVCEVSFLLGSAGVEKTSRKFIIEIERSIVDRPT